MVAPKPGTSRSPSDSASPGQAEAPPAVDADLAESEEAADEEEADEELAAGAAELVDSQEESASVSEVTPPDSKQALVRLDALQVYMNEVQRHPLLSPEEERQLTTKYAETQDVATAAKLVTANLRLVVKIAFDYRRAYRNMMDLIQEGNIGLMQAVKRYDPYRGVKLSSYAAWWIRAYMLRFILNNWRLVKLGTTQAQRKLFFNLGKEKAKLTAMGIEPTSIEIAQRLDVEEKEVVEMERRLARADASLDSPMTGADGRATSRMELLPTSTAGPDALAEGAELQEMVRERLEAFRETLSGKDLVIFDSRMIAEDPLTLQKLGDQFGISRERVRQLEARLSRRLREYLQESLGDAVEVSA